MTPENKKNYGLLILTLAILVATIFIFYLNWKYENRELTFAMLNVGQGDALFIESPTGTQILIDSGPPRKILSQLSRIMPPFDKSIDAIIITHPDQDHIGGFLDVLKNYKVGIMIEAGTYSDSNMYQNLKDEIKNQKIPSLVGRQGMRLDIGGGAVIDILFPDRDVSLWTTNEGSLISKLTFGETSVMLTGDSTSETERIILENNSSLSLTSDILKVGHHGSTTSSSEIFLKAISPQYALISSGKDNRYGHPRKEVLERLESVGAEIFRTDLLGTIIMKSDGKDTEFSFHK